MFTVAEAFLKFKSRLEISPQESDDAIRRHNEVREVLRANFAVDDDFLTGSYRRHTKTKPLQDVDIFCVLSAEKEGHYLKKSSSVVLDDFRQVLADKYGRQNVDQDARCVVVRFGTPTFGENDEDKVFSIDVAPAFVSGTNYKIPNAGAAQEWLLTNPKKHAEQATEANQNFDEQWKPLVKMIKKWNKTQGSPVPSSFLLEVMALQILYASFQGGYPRELKSFFATAATGIFDTWADPAGVGSNVTDDLTLAQRQTIADAMRATGKSVDLAILYQTRGQDAQANRIWREQVFGPLFPLS